MLKLSVIIPTYNEDQEIVKKTLSEIRKARPQDAVQVIIADSQESKNCLIHIAEDYDAQYLKTEAMGRGPQMNEAAKKASGDILYFVHADTLVHADFVEDILTSLENGYDLGCYRYRFDEYRIPLLIINSFFTRLPFIWCRGGDQTLFIKKEVFESLNGFDSTLKIMEDYDIIQRASGKFRFKIVPKNVTVSARKYAKNGYFKVQMANYKVMRQWLLGNRDTESLHNLYHKILKY